MTQSTTSVETDSEGNDVTPPVARDTDSKGNNVAPPVATYIVNNKCIDLTQSTDSDKSEEQAVFVTPAKDANTRNTISGSAHQSGTRSGGSEVRVSNNKHNHWKKKDVHAKEAKGGITYVPLSTKQHQSKPQSAAVGQAEKTLPNRDPLFLLSKSDRNWAESYNTCLEYSRNRTLGRLGCDDPIVKWLQRSYQRQLLRDRWGDVEYRIRQGKSPWSTERLDLVKPMVEQRENERVMVRESRKKKKGPTVTIRHLPVIRNEENRGLYEGLLQWGHRYGNLGTPGGNMQKSFRMEWARIAHKVSQQAVKFSLVVSTNKLTIFPRASEFCETLTTAWRRE